MHRFFKHLSGFTELEALHNKASFPIQMGYNNEYAVLRLLTPGLKPNAINITVTGKTLNITGTIPFKPGVYLQQECPCGHFKRTVELDFDIDCSKVKTELKAGILTLTLPRSLKSTSRRITVTAKG